MNTLIFNGSPRPDGDTVALIGALTAALPGPADMVDCYRADISPCVDCRACREAFRCVIDDAMQQVYRRIRAADAIVIASPIYYFTLSAQLQAVIHRTYAIDIPANVKKTALILSSGSAYVYGPAISQYYQSIVEYWGVENAGIFTANDKQNMSREKRDELYRFGKSLQG